ncbi:MAG TPA: hypothetical protein VFW94_11630 [Candidatus Acidoferrales bacterium]|nr:hypothetical protein [Candidatus Acidoferrales bacterium]
MNLIAVAVALVALLVAAVIYLRWPYTNGFGPVPRSIKNLRQSLFNKENHSRN